MSVVEATRESVLGFEAWAALSARLLRKSEAERAEILKAAHVTPEAWAENDARFGREIAGELAAGDTVRARKYGALCAAELSGRGRVGAAPTARTDAARDTTPKTLPPPAPIPEPVIVHTDVPTYGLDGELEDGEETHSPFSAPVRSEAVPSFMQRPSTPPPPASPKTQGFPAIQSPPPIAHSPPPIAHVGLDDRTLGFSSEGPVSVPLPFHKDPAKGFDAYLASAPHPAARQSGQTMMSPIASPLPGPPVIDRTPELTVEQYAALCVCCALFPERTQAVWYQFGVPDESAHRELNAEWHLKMGADNELQQRWIALCEHYRGYYAQWPGARR